MCYSPAMIPNWIKALDSKTLEKEVRLYTKMFNGGPGGVFVKGTPDYDRGLQELSWFKEELTERATATRANRASAAGV